MIDTVREVAATGAVFVPLATGLVLWTRSMQSAALARRFHGKVSVTGGCVRFEHAGYSIQLDKPMAGHFMGHVRSKSTLTIWLEMGSPLVMGSFDTMIALLAKSEPVTFSSVFTGHLSVMLVGEKHSAIIDQCFRENCVPLLGDVLADAVPDAAVRISQRIRLSWRRPPRRQWALSLVGVPEQVYADPKTLAPILSNLTRLCELVCRSWGYSNESVRK